MSDPDSTPLDSVVEPTPDQKAEPKKDHGKNKKTWLDRMVEVFAGEPKDKDHILNMINDAKESGIINDITHEIIDGALEMSDQHVRDIMIPRSQVDFINLDTSWKHVLEQLVKCQHSRVPVLDEDNDKIIGVLLAKDVLQLIVSSDFDLERMNTTWVSILRKPMVVPESKRLNTLLKDFRGERNHMAIVIDEYGAVSGIVTIEDILEEIVGEIVDEFDEEEVANIVKLDDQRFLVQALTEVDEFNEFFACEFSEEDFGTIGGFVTQAFGHLPTRGESVQIDRLKFDVNTSDNRRIKTLKVSMI